MTIRSFLTGSLACSLLFGASACKPDPSPPKKNKEKPVAEDPVLAPGHHLLITEIVPHAEHSLMDADGDPSDWIELHNKGPESVALGEFALTDDPETPLKWPFPERSLDAGAFLIVFASGKNRTGTDGGLHANFKLASGGEYLALVRIKDRQAVHTFAPVFPKVPKGKSYGYEFQDGAVSLGQLRSFDAPSPGAPNGQPPGPDANP